MNSKSKKYQLVRKGLYVLAFLFIIGCFIYLSNKYEDLSKTKKITFNSYYKNIVTDDFTIINANNLISYAKEGRHLIFIGNSSSKWSQKYAEVLSEVLNEVKVEAGYYDIKNDKTQQNSNYYAVVELLNDHLTTTDSSNNNLFAPSFYIIIDGKIKYYNIDTVAMKNNANTKDYWNKETRDNFKREIKNNIKRYYLNN